MDVSTKKIPFHWRLIWIAILALVAAGLACNLPTPTADPIGAASPSASPQSDSPEDWLSLVSTDSPSQFVIVYIKDGNLWSWDADNDRRQLTFSGTALFTRLSPDSKVAAYTVQTDEFHQEIWVVNTVGGDQRRLVTIADLNALSARSRESGSQAANPHQIEWIPNSHDLAFNMHQSFESQGITLLDDLHTVNADSGQISTVLTAGLGGEFYFSPDGKQIALVTPTNVSIVDADGTNRREDALTYKGVITYSEYNYYAHPIWAPASDFLMAAIPADDPLANPRGPTTVWRIEVDGQPAIQLGSFKMAPFFQVEPSFSPDLSYLIYLREGNKPQSNLLELHIATPDGFSDMLYYPAAVLEFYGWAPDSRHFLFSLGQERSLQLGRVFGKIRPQDSALADPLRIAWADDQHMIIIKNNQSTGMWEMYLAGLDGALTMIDSAQGETPTFDFAGHLD